MNPFDPQALIQAQIDQARLASDLARSRAALATQPTRTKRAPPPLIILDRFVHPPVVLDHGPPIATTVSAEVAEPQGWFQSLGEWSWVLAAGAGLAVVVAGAALWKSR